MEKSFKGMVKTLDLCNLEEIIENNMGNMEQRMEKKLEESMEIIVNTTHIGKAS